MASGRNFRIRARHKLGGNIFAKDFVLAFVAGAPGVAPVYSKLLQNVFFYRFFNRFALRDGVEKMAVVSSLFAVLLFGGNHDRIITTKCVCAIFVCAACGGECAWRESHPPLQSTHRWAKTHAEETRVVFVAAIVVGRWWERERAKVSGKTTMTFASRTKVTARLHYHLCLTYSDLLLTAEKW